MKIILSLICLIGYLIACYLMFEYANAGNITSTVFLGFTALFSLLLFLDIKNDKK